KKINEIIITYNDGSSETLSEADAMQKGIIHPDYGNQKTRELSSVSGSLRLKSDGQNPVYFLDGKEINTAVLSEIDPKGIESINVLKGPAAINKYGEAGKNGIVEIKMKKAASAELMTIQEDGSPVMQGQMDKLQLKGDNEMNFRGTIRLIRDTVTGRENRIFLKAEFPPSVDIMEWRRFLEKNLTTIIEEAATKGIEPGNYVVQVRFIVETDGSLSDVRVITHPGYGIDKKILEIMQGSPTWKPAIQNGRAVRCYHTQPITFVVSDGDKVEPTTLQKNTDPAKIKSFSLHKLAGVPQSEEIVSCVFSMDSDKGDIKVVTNKGNKLTSATKNLLASAKSGKTLIVEKIFVRRNGHQQEMPSQVYKM
ncbi:MAG TPA: energy transducer TonB, partial [Flavisolibacter sp.]|nr:energy transducer TonB [Flavisolibacter sp.]